MEQITVTQILEATGGRLLQGYAGTPVNNLVIDSRQVETGDLFVPFRGERVDGHRFIASAFAKGAAACLTETEDGDFRAGVTGPLILVTDSRQALQRIGAYYRKRLSLPIVGVTGSVGKTSTREMLSAALSAGYRVFETPYNYNGQLGVPMTLSRIGAADQAAVLEMGMSLPGEMEVIARIACVTMGVVTNIGVSHMESLGSRDRICQEKLHMLDGMNPEGKAVLNGDDDMLRKYGSRLPFQTVWFGTGADCDYRAVDVHTEENRAVFRIVGPKDQADVRLQVPGIHNVRNGLAAVTAACEMGVPMREAVRALEAFRGFSRRLEFQQVGDVTLIDDSYNASPDSMRAALQVLDSVACPGRKIAVLADMWELGPDSARLHCETGEYGGSLSIDVFFLVGERAGEIGKGIKKSRPDALVTRFADNAQAAQALKDLVRPGDMVLLKGSNGMHLNEIGEALKQHMALPANGETP